MATPGVRHLDIYQGDDYTHTISFQTAAGAAINVAGRAYTAQIREFAEDTATPVAFAVDVTGAAGGAIVLSLTDTQTRALPASAVWDLQEIVGTATTTILAGTIACSRDVTRA